MVRKGEAISTNAMRCAMFKARGKKDCTLHGFRSAFATWARSETYPVTLPSGELRRVRLYDEALIEKVPGPRGGATKPATPTSATTSWSCGATGSSKSWAAYCGKVLEASAVTHMRRRIAA